MDQEFGRDQVTKGVKPCGHIHISITNSTIVFWTTERPALLYNPFLISNQEGKTSIRVTGIRLFQKLQKLDCWQQLKQNMVAHY